MISSYELRRRHLFALLRLLASGGFACLARRVSVATCFSNQQTNNLTFTKRNHERIQYDFEIYEQRILEEVKARSVRT
jgi:hypothetical protein